MYTHPFHKEWRLDEYVGTLIILSWMLLTQFSLSARFLNCTYKSPEGKGFLITQVHENALYSIWIELLLNIHVRIPNT